MNTIMENEFTLMQSTPVDGNAMDYKVYNGTAYHMETSNEIIGILDRVLNTKQRIRVFYGDINTGICWNDEFETMGYVKRSTGRIKIPLLIPKVNSFGGGGLLDHCIIRITQDKKVLYSHPNFTTGEWEIKEVKKEYPFDAYNNLSGNSASFKTRKQAERYIQFITGKKNSK